MAWRMQKSMTGVSSNEFSDLSLSYWEDGQGNGMVRSHGQTVFTKDIHSARQFFNKRLRNWYELQGRPVCGLITGKEAWTRTWPSARETKTRTRKPSRVRMSRLRR